MKVVGYGASEPIRRYCDSHGLHLAELYNDHANNTPEALYQRHGLAQALDAVSNGHSLIVDRLDSLTSDPIGQEYLLRAVWQAGGTVTSCEPSEASYCNPDDPSDPSRTLVRHMLTMFTDWHRALEPLRNQPVRLGYCPDGRIGLSACPYGWRRTVDGRTVVNAYETPIVARIMDLRGNGWGYLRIARKLEEEQYRNRAGRMVWHKQTVRRIVERETGGTEPHGTATDPQTD